MLDGDALLDMTHPLVPQIYPVKNAKIDGASFFGAGGTLGTSPKITWSAPMGATPAEILVQAVSVVPDGQGGSALGGGSAMYVKGSATSVTLPLSFLATNTEYIFRILSWYSLRGPRACAHEDPRDVLLRGGGQQMFSTPP